MVRASIDIGSNTILLLVAKVSSDEMEVLHDEVFVTGLGRGIDKTKKFCSEAMNDSMNALLKCREIIDNFHTKISKKIITATEASRVVSNAKSFFKKIEMELNCPVQIITAKEEAYYTGLGVSICKRVEKVDENCVLMDIGGASTELMMVQLKPYEMIKSTSLPLGSVRGTDWYFDDCFESNLNNILKDFDLGSFSGSALIGVAGTITLMSCMIFNKKEFDEKFINNCLISIDEIEHLFKSIRDLDSDEILKKYPISGKRSKTIKAGIHICLLIARQLNIKNIKVSTYGLRHGTAFKGEING